MGSTFSEPVVPNLRQNYVGVALRSPDKVRLINAPHEVSSGFGKLIPGLASYKDEYGIHKYKCDGMPFTLGSSKESSTNGKIFCINLFEEMHRLGYDPVVSSDMVRHTDNCVLFFHKALIERPKAAVVCLAPGQADKLILVRAPPLFINTVKQAIQESWRKGIQRENEYDCNGEKLYEIKLCGVPWHDHAGEDNVLCRRMMLQILGRLGSIHYRLITGANIKGGTDSLFFVYDESYYTTPNELCFVSMNKNDRIRLINCVQLKPTIEKTITDHYSPPQRQEDKYGSWEFKLNGYPWCCSGDEAILSRRLISRISESMLRSGWALSTAIDISRSLDDKSVLLYCKCAPQPNARFACVALSDIDKIRLLDFSADDQQKIRDALFNGYMPGFESEYQRDEGVCYQIRLNGCPWTSEATWNIHARAAMISVLHTAGNLGWRLVASADVSSKYHRQDNGPDYPEDVHSWYFVYWPSGQANDEPPPPSYWSLPSAPPDDNISPPPSYNFATGNF